MKRLFDVSLRTALFLLTFLDMTACGDQGKLLEYKSWSGKDNDENEVKVYRPYPVLFVHGFASGSPQTWDDIIKETYFVKNAYEIYAQYVMDEASAQGHFLIGPNGARVPYLERVDINDANGSIDTYNVDDELVHENPQGTSLGWADKLAVAIDAVLEASGAKKVILVCHSMGGLAARELVTNANSAYGEYARKIDRIITIDTPHAGSPLARVACNLGNVHRGGWKFPVVGWILTVLIEPVKAFLHHNRNIDLAGEAVRDMNPMELEGAPNTSGSHFMKNLGERRHWESPPVYTLCGVNSRSFAILLSGGSAFSHEPSDGVVPYQSQRGFPFVRDPGDGQYVVNPDGRIAIQERMFETPDKIDSSRFLMSSMPLQDFAPLDVEKDLFAPHGGPDGAPFVAAGLKHEGGIVKRTDIYGEQDYILRYMTYNIPEVEFLECRWKPAPEAGYIGLYYRFALRNDNFPATSKVYVKCTDDGFDRPCGNKNWISMPVPPETERVRPFENEEPAEAGFDRSMFVAFPTTNVIWSSSIEQYAVKIVNPAASISSNAFQLCAARTGLQSMWYLWRIMAVVKEDNKERIEWVTGSGAVPTHQIQRAVQKTDYQTCRQQGDKVDCENKKDGLYEYQDIMYLQFQLPEKLSGWPIHRAELLLSREARVNFLSGPSEYPNEWDKRPIGTPIGGSQTDSGMYAVDIKEFLPGNGPFTLAVEASEIPNDSYTSSSAAWAFFVIYEPKNYVEASGEQ